MHSKAFLLILFVFFSLFHNAPVSANVNDSPSPLQQAFDAFSHDAALANANWTFYVKDISAGETILAHNTDRLMLPASVQKLITTASAIMILGNDHLYATLLQTDGTVDHNEILQGNIYIKGSGDPAFGSSRLDDSLALDLVFERWTQALQQIGVNAINGHIIADERIFDDEMIPHRWLWGHIGNYFGAGASGLSANENEYTVFFNAGSSIGSPAEVVRTEPHVPGMSFINRVTTGAAGSGDQVYIYGAPWVHERLLTGTVPLRGKDFPVRGSLPDPPGLVAESFRSFLVKNGIQIQGNSYSYRTLDPLQVQVSDNRTTIRAQESPMFFDIIYRTNLNSINSYAENLLKSIGHASHGKGSYKSGLQAIDEFWRSHGIDTDRWALYDGSGLSPSNRITAEQLMTVLAFAARQPSFPLLMQSLPLAGYSGSLANLFLGSMSEGLLRAKSGYLEGARSYAGYTTMQNGNLAAFVIIANDYNASPAAMRHKMVRLMDAITQHEGQKLVQ